jgi:hypothetical protein
MAAGIKHWLAAARETDPIGQGDALSWAWSGLVAACVLRLLVGGRGAGGLGDPGGGRHRSGLRWRRPTWSVLSPASGRQRVRVDHLRRDAGGSVSRAGGSGAILTPFVAKIIGKLVAVSNLSVLLTPRRRPIRTEVRVSRATIAPQRLPGNRVGDGRPSGIHWSCLIAARICGSEATLDRRSVTGMPLRSRNPMMPTSPGPTPAESLSHTAG